MSFISENKQIIHIAIETIVITGIAKYFFNCNKQLSNEMSLLKKHIQDRDETIRGFIKKTDQYITDIDEYKKILNNMMKDLYSDINSVRDIQNEHSVKLTRCRSKKPFIKKNSSLSEDIDTKDTKSKKQIDGKNGKKTDKKTDKQSDKHLDEQCDEQCDEQLDKQFDEQLEEQFDEQSGEQLNGCADLQMDKKKTRTHFNNTVLCKNVTRQSDSFVNRCTESDDDVVEINTDELNKNKQHITMPDLIEVRLRGLENGATLVFNNHKDIDEAYLENEIYKELKELCNP